MNNLRWKFRTGHTWLAALAIIGALASQADAITFWVSETGSSSGAGTQALPWRSLEDAQTYIRNNDLNDNMTGDIIVNILPGEYPDLSGIVFTKDDSGSNGFSVIYRSTTASGALSNGTAYVHTALSPQFTRIGTSNVWTTNIGAGYTIPNLARSYPTTGSILCGPAREPNQAPRSRFPMYRGNYRMSTSGSSPSNEVVDLYFNGSFGVTGDFSALASAEIVWWSQVENLPVNSPDYHPRDWGCEVSKLKTLETGHLTFVSKKEAGEERFFLQGIEAFLNAENEFFYDPMTGQLKYYSASDPSGSVWVPMAKKAINFLGDQVSQVHHIKLEGLSICYTQSSDDIPTGAVQLKESNNITLKGCDIFAAGAGGIYIVDTNSANRIENCAVRQCGSFGILIENSQKGATTPSKDHVISNCLVHNIGALYSNSIRAAGVGILNAEYCTVSHVEIRHCIRYATTLRGNFDPFDGGNNGERRSTGNVFEYIRATDSMNDSGDGGVIHCSQLNGENGDNVNTWRQILASGAYADSDMQDTEPKGLYVDRPDSCFGQIFQSVKLNWIDGLRTRIKVSPENETNYLSITNCNFDVQGNLTAMNDANISGQIGLLPGFPYKDVNTVIIDDHTSNYSEDNSGDISANWANETISGAYEGDIREVQNGTSSMFAEWRPHVLTSGTYKVYVWKNSGLGNPTTRARYTINPGHPQYQWQAYVDQTNASKANPNSWEFIGYGYFPAGDNAGSSHSVRLAGNSEGTTHVYADAVKFEFYNTAAPPTAGLVATSWWKFENNGSDSAGGNNMTFPNGTNYSTVSAQGDYSLILNGTNRYGSVADNELLDVAGGSFSVSLWFYRASGTGNLPNLRILSKGASNDTEEGWCIWGSTTQMNASLTPGGIKSNGDPKYPRVTAARGYSGTDQWHHFAMVVNRPARTITVYVDGVASGAAVFNTNFSAESINSPLALNAGRSVAANNYWNGRVDDIRIFKGTALTATQIAALAVPSP